MKKHNSILLIGALLVALRLFFPVLVCNPEHLTCNQGTIDFFSAQPRWDYFLDTTRTYTEAAGIGIITLVLYLVLKKGKS